MMTLFREFKNWDHNMPEGILDELKVFSRYEVKVEVDLQTGNVLQKFYVPADELEFYSKWKEKVVSELLTSKQNAVLIQGIARRHRIRLPK